jgi:hypothetical protein
VVQRLVRIDVREFFLSAHIATESFEKVFAMIIR